MEPSDLSPAVHARCPAAGGQRDRRGAAVGLSTPAMSHALARVRERLGDPLLVRAGRGMVLTLRARRP
ncbi:MAG: LysR family transcriptional regulator [Myxococcales bacterium]|nr:LysR family transcriptional regulator [Myxococcales bacterium]